jgi:hypothetical protein
MSAACAGVQAKPQLNPSRKEAGEKAPMVGQPAGRDGQKSAWFAMRRVAVVSDGWSSSREPQHLAIGNKRLRTTAFLSGFSHLIDGQRRLGEAVDMILVSGCPLIR